MATHLNPNYTLIALALVLQLAESATHLAEYAAHVEGCIWWNLLLMAHSLIT